MLFGVIYSFDVLEVELPRMTIRPPPEQSELWTRTEHGTSELNATLDTTGWYHEKWCACLDLEQFTQFRDRLCLRADDVETMGSLGAPLPDGTLHYGCLPAVSFDGSDNDCLANAYVTPYLEPGDDQLVPGLQLPAVGELADESHFELVKDWMLERWGS